MDSLNFDFHWAAVTLANTLKYTPVNSVPIIPTALARNLNSHMNIAHVQGTCKYGYLTMDQTRKLLLVLESDPKAYTLPLIGIWLSGITHIYSPQVWACSLRYLYSCSIQERVLSESGGFLIVLYSMLHKDPEFYECLPCGCTELGFQLLTSKETLRLFKNVGPSDKNSIQFDLSSENKNAEMEFFSKISKDVSIKCSSQSSSPSKLSVSDHDSGVEDDASPRPFPRPHPTCLQVSEIQPSVPELSIVFDGNFTEAEPMSRHVSPVDKKNLLAYQPAKKVFPLDHPCHQIQSSDCRKQIFTTCTREPSPRQLPGQFKQRIPVLKPANKVQVTLQQQPSCSTAGYQARKSLGSSSPFSSPSTPCSGSSPIIPEHQLGTPSEKLYAKHDAIQGKEELPISGPLIPNSKQPPIPSQPPWHNCAWPPPNLRPVEFRIPVQGPPCCSSCVCNCQLHGHVQYSPTNILQGISKAGSSQTSEIQTSVAQENAQLMFHQNVECVNGGFSPTCATSSSINLGHYEIMGNCSLDGDTARIFPPADHAVCSTCMHTPSPRIGSDNGMMGLSPDVYRMLAEQDRQLKLLQAQIQRLLEAQTLQPCSIKTIANNGIQSEKQLEFVTMETCSSPGLHMKKSVSIAVSTGASLFLNAPLEGNKGSTKQDDGEMSNEDINISMNTEKDRSQASIASSLKAVDIPSFVDSIHVVEEGSGESSGGVSVTIATGMTPTSVLNGNVAMCSQTTPLEGTVDHSVAINEPDIEHAISSTPSVPPDDQKFYKDILGQVKHFLKETYEEITPCVTKEDQIASESTAPSKTSKTKRRSSALDPDLTDNDSVLNATWKQLRNLGVNFDSSDKMMKNVHKVENASILACINPEAVVPGLNYISFANVGMSGLTPNGVDLSMEANAIALKYLNESQLSQLSLNHSNQKNSMDLSLQTLLHNNTDRSLMGFNLISPTNMSFATKKYMKRYGLLQSTDSSGDEEEQQADNHRRGDSLEPVLQLGISPVSDNFSHWKHPSERVSERQLPPHPGQCDIELFSNHPSDSEGLVLKHVTNAVLPLRILQQSNESSVPFLKELKPKTELLPGKAQSTQHPDKENLDVPVLPETLHTPILDHLSHVDNMNSVGTFLDVQQLRQLPKLF
ncbi:SCL-interrupting locus protein isoform X2 [Paroedura picta]